MEHAMMGLATIDLRLRQIADRLMTLGDSAAFSPVSIGAKLLPHLFVLDIERDTPKGTALLRIRLVGTALDDVFRRPLRGHTLEEFIHGPRGNEVIASFHHCAETREPIWMRQVVHIRDRTPRFVEGVAIYLKPERIYGGLIVGEYVGSSATNSFERIPL
jgi:hypothetical protein